MQRNMEIWTYLYCCHKGLARRSRAYQDAQLAVGVGEQDLPGEDCARVGRRHVELEEVVEVLLRLRVSVCNKHEYRLLCAGHP